MTQDDVAITGDLDGRTGLIASGFDGFRAVEIAEAVRRSSERREIVSLCEPF